MNLLLLKQLSILAGLLGGFMGVLALLPSLTLFVFLLAFILPAVLVIVYMKQNNLIGIIDKREGAIFGSVIGAVSFCAGFLVFMPLSLIVNFLFGLFHVVYFAGFLSYLSFGFGTIFLVVTMVIFIALMSALLNGFMGMSTIYVYEMISGEVKQENQNTSIDFEIK